MSTFDCSAILFDLDGVLVNSTHSVARQWRIWGEENHLDIEKLLEIAHGRRTIEVVRLLAPQLDAHTEVLKIERREAEDTDGVSVMAGAARLLGAIPEERWCVVTSGTRFLATSRLRLAKLPIPEVLVSADDVSEGKPHPEPYLKGARLLGTKPAQCLVIEDAPAGIEAAHAAGMKAIGLTSTYSPSDLSRSDGIVRTLNDIHVEKSGSGLRLRLLRTSS